LIDLTDLLDSIGYAFGGQDKSIKVMQ